MQNNKIVISSMKCKKVNQVVVTYTSQEKFYTFVNGQNSSTRNILYSNLKMIVTYTENFSVPYDEMELVTSKDDHF